MSIHRRKLFAGTGALVASLIGGADPLRARGLGPSPVERLRGKLRGGLYMPSEAGYGDARRGHGTTPVDGRFPALIVQPEGPDDIARALEFAAGQALDVSVRSGGHDLLGASTAARALLIDLSRMNAIALDPATGLARVGAGMRAGELTGAAAPHGLAPTLGMNPNVGVGGLTLGGGMGWLSGTHGATVDNLVAAEIVTADGHVLRADARENPDLFWALRGGGGNFGVATAFTYRLRPVSKVLAGDIGFKVDPARFLAFMRDFLAESPDALELGVLFTLGPQPTAIVRLCWCGDPDEGEAALRPLRAFAPAVIDTVKPQDFASFAGNVAHFDNMFLRGGEFDGLTGPVIDAFAGVIDKGGPEGCLIGVLHYMHGALCRVPEADTPFLRKQGHILYNVVAPWQGPARQQDKVDWALAASEALREVNSRRIYINYLSYKGEDYVREAYGPHYGRLREIKRRYDPGNLLRNNRNIRP